jgi:hypothetical protein
VSDISFSNLALVKIKSEKYISRLSTRYAIQYNQYLHNYLRLRPTHDFFILRFCKKHSVCYQLLIDRIVLFGRVSEWLLLSANSAIFQLYHGENRLIFNEMMMRFALFQTNTLSWICIVLAH